MSRGYFGIGIVNGKKEANIGTLWRSANLFGASFMFTTGRRYQKQCSDTMATHRHVPYMHYADFDDMYSHLPFDCQLVGVELCQFSVDLPSFEHPQRAMYLLGAEDHGLNPDVMERCHKIVRIPSIKEFSLNVSVAGSLVMYDRVVKTKAPLGR